MTATSLADDQRDQPSKTPSDAVALVTDTVVFARRNIEHIRQVPEKLVDVAAQPLMFLLLYAFVFGGAISIETGNYREYLIGGIRV